MALFDWFAKKRTEVPSVSPPKPTCTCLDESVDRGNQSGFVPQLHTEQQDQSCAAWQKMLDAIDTAAHTKSESLTFDNLTWEEIAQVITLPPEIGTLTAVKHIDLFGSSLVSIPPDIGRMRSLESLNVYRSYRLHYLPFEITRCTRLRSSCISTRALYGNYKYRPHFPELRDSAFCAVTASSGGLDLPSSNNACSLCGTPLGSVNFPRWISLKLTNDVFPLLLIACSEDCLLELPTPPAGYVDHAHQGGDRVQQPGASGFAGSRPRSG